MRIGGGNATTTAADAWMAWSSPPNSSTRRPAPVGEAASRLKSLAKETLQPAALQALQRVSVTAQQAAANEFSQVRVELMITRRRAEGAPAAQNLDHFRSHYAGGQTAGQAEGGRHVCLHVHVGEVRVGAVRRF